MLEFLDYQDCHFFRSVFHWFDMFDNILNALPCYLSGEFQIIKPIKDFLFGFFFFISWKQYISKKVKAIHTWGSKTVLILSIFSSYVNTPILYPFCVRFISLIHMTVLNFLYKSCYFVSLNLNYKIVLFTTHWISLETNKQRTFYLKINNNSGIFMAQAYNK